TILTKNLKLANRLIDSVNVGYMSHQLGYIHQVIKNNDSAYYYYYNALKYFENKKTTRKTKMDIITQAYTYNNIANLQKDEKDYLGSQSTIVQGINFILSTSDIEENKEYLSNAYNLLGLNLKK